MLRAEQQQGESRKSYKVRSAAATQSFLQLLEDRKLCLAGAATSMSEVGADARAGADGVQQASSSTSVRAQSSFSRETGRVQTGNGVPSQVFNVVRAQLAEQKQQVQVQRLARRQEFHRDLDLGEVAIPTPRVQLSFELPIAPCVDEATALLEGCGVQLNETKQRAFRVLYRIAADLEQQLRQQELDEAAATSPAGRAQQTLVRAVLDGQTVTDSFMFHCPQELIAGLVGCSVRHLTRLLDSLEEAGLLAWGGQVEPVPCGWRSTFIGPGHKGKKPARNLYTGTLFRVRLLQRVGEQNGAFSPLKLVRSNYRTQHRDLERDTMTGRLPKVWMSELQTIHAGQEISTDRRHHAVLSFITNTPLEVVRTSGQQTTQTTQDTVYALPLLAEQSSVWQVAAVDRTAHQLSHHLREPSWHAWWCRTLWHAIHAGRLQALSTALMRLLIDAREWPEVLKLGAVFAARWKSGTEVPLG